MATVDRKLLQQALAQGQQISQAAATGQGFDPRGGVGVLAAQLATAGIGAFAQNKARKQLAELEQQQQAAFGQQFPQFAGLAGQTTPETRQAAIQAQLTGQIKRQFERPTPLSPEGKKAADIKAGFLPETTPLDKPEDLEKKRERVFKQTTDLRKEFTKNSGEFIKQRDAFDRVRASVEAPSAAGDLALIFNYMKILDPGSTVREGEFANAENSAGIPQRLRGQYNKVISGQRLAPEQRDDFFDRAGKLFDKAVTRQKKRVDQFKGIAERNSLPVEDAIIDLIGQDPIKAEAVSAVEEPAPVAQEFTDADRQAAREELQRRRAEKSNINIADNGGVE